MDESLGKGRQNFQFIVPTTSNVHGDFTSKFCLVGLTLIQNLWIFILNSRKHFTHSAGGKAMRSDNPTNARQVGILTARSFCSHVVTDLSFDFPGHCPGCLDVVQYLQYITSLLFAGPPHSAV